MIRTKRLLLIPAAIQMLEAEIEDKSRLSGLLNAVIPADWPPETLVDAFPWFIDQLKSNPEHNCWYSWYALFTENKTSQYILVGSAGFKGYPDESGKVEIGYSVLDDYQRKSIAAEMVQALTNWAFSQGVVNSIIAETTIDNFASIRVLEKNGFVKQNQDSDAVFYLLKK